MLAKGFGPEVQNVEECHARPFPTIRLLPIGSQRNLSKFAELAKVDLANMKLWLSIERACGHCISKQDLLSEFLARLQSSANALIKRAEDSDRSKLQKAELLVEAGARTGKSQPYAGQGVPVAPLATWCFMAFQSSWSSKTKKLRTPTGVLGLSNVRPTTGKKNFGCVLRPEALIDSLRWYRAPQARPEEERRGPTFCHLASNGSQTNPANTDLMFKKDYIEKKIGACIFQHTKWFDVSAYMIYPRVWDEKCGIWDHCADSIRASDSWNTWKINLVRCMGFLYKQVWQGKQVWQKKTDHQATYFPDHTFFTAYCKNDPPHCWKVSDVGFFCVDVIMVLVHATKSTILWWQV